MFVDLTNEPSTQKKFHGWAIIRCNSQFLGVPSCVLYIKKLHNVGQSRHRVPNRFKGNVQFHLMQQFSNPLGSTKRN